LYYVLQNRLYLGEIVHRGVRHQGEHEPIITGALFEAVQASLSANRKKRPVPKRADRCWLAGLARDAAGEVMRTSFSYGRGGKLYRYYVSGSLDPSRPEHSKGAKRVPAAPLERLVLRALSDVLQRQVTSTDAMRLIAAVELRDRSIQIGIQNGKLLEPHEPATSAIARLQPRVEPHRLAIEGERLLLIIDRQPVFRGGDTSGRTTADAPTTDAVALLRSAHQLLREHSMSPLEPEHHSLAAAPAWQRQRRMMSAGLLSPQVQKEIMRGSFNGSVDQLLTCAPLAWADQELE
jgi:hypothetical protein